MNHDDDVSAGIEREPVTGFLVATVTLVDVMDVDLHPFESSGNSDSVIMAAIIHENDGIDELLVAHLGVGLPQGFGGIIRRHYHYNFFVSIHKGGVNNALDEDENA